MSLSHLLKKFNPPSPARAASANAGTDLSPDNRNDSELPQPQRYATEPTPVMSRRWRKKTSSSGDRLSSSPPTRTSTPPLKSTPENPTPEAGAHRMPMPMTLPVGPNVFLPDLSQEPLQGTSLGSGLAPESLTEAWNVVKDGPSNSDLNRGLDILGDAVEKAQNNTKLFQPLITAAVGAVEQTTVAKSIKEGIDKFFDGMPVFMNALDAVADLHPFIGVVVLAFKTVYTLEMRRRDNDKKIVALFAEMKDMMGVLLLLKAVENDKLIAPDGTSIEDRLRSLVACTVDDIKLCSNICDTYVKKRLLAKVMLGSIWDAKLLEFVQLFTKRRQDFEFELSIHTSQGVDKANIKLDTIGHETHTLNEKMDIMMAMFQQLVGPEQKELSALVTANGGVKALRNNDKMLLLLEETANKSSSTPNADGHRAPRAKSNDTKPNADDLKNDIFEDPSVAVEKNRDVFFRKFEVQKNQIIDELTLVVKRESDRVIKEVKGGPHERVLDRSVHEIWKEMGWRGNVKARHFVLALRDYYLEKVASESTTVRGISASTITGSQCLDAWAIKYIDIIRLQPILEAIDDDASGFITIREMNRFTSSRPADWSLPHWMAFWAVGFRASIINYAKRIEELFAKMEGVRSHVLPPNREAIDDYFNEVWEPVHALTAAVISLQPEPNNPDKFKPYLEGEEARLAANLKAVDYIIDGTDTLTLITGVGRVEKTLFPLLYVQMKRHYEIMRIMRTKVVDSRELWNSIESVLHVKDAIRYRVDDLANTFSQQRLDPEKQFRTFAHGIFKYFHDEKALWSGNYVHSLCSSVIEYNDNAEDPNVRPENILKYEYTDELSLDHWVYDGHSVDDIPNYGNVGSPLRDILGHWYGCFYEDDGVRETDGTDSMVTLVLAPAEGEHELKANAWSNRGRHTVTGSWSMVKEDMLQIKLKMTFATASWDPLFFDGHFDPKRNALTGCVRDISEDPDDSGGKMEFRRIPPRYLTVYPSIKDLSQNKPRALWKFAIAAVRNDIRRDSWSWSFFSQRQNDRESVISLTIRSLFFGKPPDREESAKLCTAVQRLTPADACFYSSKINRIRAHTLVHLNAWCDSCDGCIGGARLFCLDCANKNTEVYDGLDLCSRPECIAARVTNREDLEGAHEPNHKLVKARTAVLQRQHGRAHTAAKKAFERVEKVCKRIAEASKQPETGPNEKSASNSESTGDHVGDRPPTSDGTKVVPDDASVENASQESGDETGDETSSDTSESEDTRPSPQTQSGDLPTCGNCKGHLSFPFWYCIFCKDNLFICNSCDMEGVPDLTRSSGKHTEEHHLIRCLAPEEVKEAPSTEQRLASLEKRLDNMQMQFDDFSNRIEQLLHKLASNIG